MRKEIEKIVLNSDIPMSRKFEVIDYFAHLWDEYFYSQKEEYIEAHELRDMWFYLKINLLTKLCSTNIKAYEYLSRELCLNAKKFENDKYSVKSIFGKEINNEVIQG